MHAGTNLLYARRKEFMRLQRHDDVYRLSDDGRLAMAE